MVVRSSEVYWGFGVRPAGFGVSQLQYWMLKYSLEMTHRLQHLRALVASFLGAYDFVIWVQHSFGWCGVAVKQCAVSISLTQAKLKHQVEQGWRLHAEDLLHCCEFRLAQFDISRTRVWGSHHLGDSVFLYATLYLIITLSKI